MKFRRSIRKPDREKAETVRPDGISSRLSFTALPGGAAATHGFMEHKAPSVCSAAKLTKGTIAIGVDSFCIIFLTSFVSSAIFLMLHFTGKQACLTSALFYSDPGS